MFRLRGTTLAVPVILIILLMSFNSCRLATLNPFLCTDHIQFTRARAASTMVGHRVRPASTILGKRNLTLEDCKAVALRNNLDLQVSRLAELVQDEIETSTQRKVLPHFIFSGDLGERDNYRYSYSDVLGQEGLSPNPGATGAAAAGVTSLSTAQERNSWRYSMELRWSPTDAALAYYLANSTRNERLKAHYQKVRVGQKLIGTVESSFYQLLGLQRAVPLAQNLLRQRKGIEEKNARLFREGLVPVEAYHRAGEKTRRAQRLQTGLRNEMERQRNLLAAALGISPDYCVDGGFLVEGRLGPPIFRTPLCEVEMIAVQSRPEAFQTGLTHLNSINDLKRTMVKYFPKVTGYWRHSREKNKYLRDKDWNDIGLLIYFDLLDWIVNRSESKAAQAESAKTEREMGAVALGITTQVRIATLKYTDALDRLKNAHAALKSYERVLHAVEARHSLQKAHQIAVEEARADIAEARIEEISAIAEANAALADIRSAMGINYNEPLPPA